MYSKVLAQSKSVPDSKNLHQPQKCWDCFLITLNTVFGHKWANTEEDEKRDDLRGRVLINKEVLTRQKKDSGKELEANKLNAASHLLQYSRLRSQTFVNRCFKSEVGLYCNGGQRYQLEGGTQKPESRLIFFSMENNKAMFVWLLNQIYLPATSVAMAQWTV